MSAQLGFVLAVAVEARVGGEGGRRRAEGALLVWDLGKGILVWVWARCTHGRL